MKLNSNKNVTILKKTPKNLDCSKKPLQRRTSKLIDRQFYSKDRYLDDLEPFKLQTRSMARGQQKNKERTNNAIEKHSNSNQNVTILQKTPKNLDCAKKPLQRKKSKLIDPQFYPEDDYLDDLEPFKMQTRSMARGQQKNKEQTSNAESRPLAAKGENFDDNKWQTPRPTINAENVMLRSQVLSQVCNEFGLKCHSLIDNMCFLETYYISSKATSTNNELTLIIDQTFNGEIVKFKYSCSKSGNIFNFHWPFCNLSFIWAFRGICVEAFFPTIREQFGYPQIEEPNDEEFACQSAGKNFSIFDVHNELRLDELANDLMLIYLQKLYVEFFFVL
uniref:Uncharacterized protein n=1 Tax=Meloidogyne enterolobii TaxID=390850 RepID=A0A6V7XYD3_MELEN|nr:unnamed protein product [Meloidogyne enterolobii]